MAMKVLISCERFGVIRDAFIKAGHDAMSCDLVDTLAPGPHYAGDVRDILTAGWDLMIAHPDSFPLLSVVSLVASSSAISRMDIT